jgi:hypothetical protein
MRPLSKKEGYDHSSASLGLVNTSIMIDNKSDPTKDPEFQKVIRHFVTTPPKPHSAMKVGKRKTKASTKASFGVPSDSGKSKQRSK